MSNTNNITPQPHKWAEVIKAWADGKQIQYRSRVTNNWLDCAPSSDEVVVLVTNMYEREWRIKPEVKTGWIVIFSYTAGVQNLIDRIFDTKDQAQQYAELAFEKELTVITVIQITYTEGEGLES